MLRRALQQFREPRKRDFVFHTLSYLFTRGLPFLAVFLTARVLEIDDFGRFVGAISLFMALMLLVDLGLALTTITCVARASREGPEAAGLVLLLVTAITLVLALLASGVLLLSLGAIERFVFGGEAMRAYLLPGVLYVPTMALGLILQAGLQGVQGYRQLARIGVIGGTCHLALVVGLGMVAGGPAAAWGAALGMTVRSVLALIDALPILRRGMGLLSMSRVWLQLRALIAVSLPASVAGFAWAPVNMFLIANMFRLPDGAAQVGAFGSAMQAYSIVMVVPGIFTQFALPRLSGLSGEDLVRRRAMLAVRYAGISLLATIAVCGPVVVAPGFWMSMLGEAYSAYGPVLMVMMFAALVSAPEGVFSNYLLASGQNWWRVALKYFWAVAVLITAWLIGERTAYATAQAFLVGWAVLMLVHVLGLVRDIRLVRPSTEA